MQLIRFKVVRASRLLMGVVIALIVIVLAVLIVRMTWMTRSTAPTSSQHPDINIVQQQDPNEAVAAFAAASSAQEEEGLFAEPQQEDEHSDESVLGIQIERIPYESSSAVDEAPKPTEAPAIHASVNVPKRVLIYHTHTHEAYEMDEGETYVELERWRTDDQNHSIVRVGRELKQLLEGYGMEVVHDVTDHEPPKLGTAYVRSLETLMGYQDTPFDLYIDLHRDAAADEQAHGKVTLSGAGRPCAQLMMLIGNGDDFNVKPYYTENIGFARQLTLAINQLQPGLCKDVLVKTGRYNQHIGKPAILIEVGNNKNTLSEALNAMPVLAEALRDVIHGEVFLPPTTTPNALPASADG